jgi:hypothetical protein
MKECKRLPRGDLHGSHASEMFQGSENRSVSKPEKISHMTGIYPLQVSAADGVL